MTNPTRAWDQVPVFGWWQTAPGIPADGTIDLTVTDRIRRNDGRMIYPAGAKRSLTIGNPAQQDPVVRALIRQKMHDRDAALLGNQFDESAWNVEWDASLTSAIFTSFYINDDPDVTPMGWQVLVSENLWSGSGKAYYVDTPALLLDLPVPGRNLADIEVPPGSPTVPAPIYAKGQPGGIAALDADGDVVNADGEKVVGGDGVDIEDVAWGGALGGHGTNPALNPVAVDNFVAGRINTPGSATRQALTSLSPGGAVTAVDNGDGTFTLSGSAVVDNGDGTFTIAA